MIRMSTIGFVILLANHISTPHSYADEDSVIRQEIRRTDKTCGSNDSSVIVNSIAADFAGVFGSSEQTRQLISNLREGTAPPKPHDEMGWGEIYIALSLAQAYATSANLTTQHALSRILAVRTDGASWGEIASESGIDLGSVVAQTRTGNRRLAATFNQSIKRRDRKADSNTSTTDAESLVRPTKRSDR